MLTNDSDYEEEEYESGEDYTPPTAEPEKKGGIGWWVVAFLLVTAALAFFLIG